MMRLAFLTGLLAVPALAQDVVLETAPPKYSTAPGGVVRMVDRVSGELMDITMENGSTRDTGSLKISLGECRYPTANPASDAFAYLRVAQGEDELFAGWMIASSPALSALDHPRYDVWVLRCINTEGDGGDG